MRLLHNLPPDASSALARVFSERDMQALVSSLHVGAQLAGDTRETGMADRFANMARLCEQIASEAANQPSGSSGKPASALGSLSPTAHRQFAAKYLTEGARKALRDAYALGLPADETPTLMANDSTLYRPKQWRGSSNPQPRRAKKTWCPWASAR